MQKHRIENPELLSSDEDIDDDDDDIELSSKEATPKPSRTPPIRTPTATPPPEPVVKKEPAARPSTSGSKGDVKRARPADMKSSRGSDAKRAHTASAGVPPPGAIPSPLQPLRALTPPHSCLGSSTGRTFSFLDARLPGILLLTPLHCRAALPQTLAELSSAAFLAVTNLAPQHWPKDAAGKAKPEASLPEMLAMLKALLASVLTVSAEQLPKQLIKEAFAGAVKGADGKVAFLTIAKKVEGKSFFALVP